jgi:exonuclease III
MEEYDVEGRFVRMDFAAISPSCSLYVPSGTSGPARQA